MAKRSKKLPEHKFHLPLKVPHDAVPPEMIVKPICLDPAKITPLPVPVADVAGVITRHETWYGSTYFVFTPNDGCGAPLDSVLDTGHEARLSLALPGGV